MEAADGLVLLDEIGAHLHPRWKLRIVDSLRNAFPRMQFLATTHEPLCLRGLEDGEVAVLKKTQNNRVYMVTNLPSISGMQVEQLLTSEHFGLSSTIDPELEEAFDRYYELLRIRKPGPQEEQELDELREFLARRRVLGTTRRERLMLEAIDSHLAVSEDGPEAREEALMSLDDDLADIIDQVDV
jgi:predicted ATP-binding protein involved in virulence